ncbi:hypothetical protein KBD45_03460 [Candidatus Dojkabacteria bacterium]|nr:hypothetical protein [Candidatus Dojkabacteria bacterium]
MADRNVRLITKRTSVPGKIPTGTTGSETNFIAQGELASNLVDKKLFSYDGSNIFEFGVNSFLGLTGGTISGNIILNSISANTYLGLPDDISITSFTYNSANTFTLTNNTGGTLSAIINVMTGLTVNGNLAANSISATTVSGGTLYSGTTNLYDIFATSAGASDVTRVQPGSNISTGGTGNFPVISLIDSPSVNNITFSGTAIGGTVQVGVVTATSLSGTNISATTYYGNGINLTGITGAFGITIDGAGSEITPGQKGFVVAPYNMGITGWDLIANTSGNCAIDIWKSTTIPTISDSITGLSYPYLTNNQFNQNSALISWTTGITNGDIIAFNVISATSVSRITLTLKTIKK